MITIRLLKNKKQLEHKNQRHLLTALPQTSKIAQQFQTLRTNIKFAVADQDLHTLVLTASVKEEDTSLYAANLAILYANEGKNVLLVDANMRNPSLHVLFTQSNLRGLSTLLSKQHPFDEAIVTTNVEHLQLLPSGPLPPNQTQLLASPHFVDFVQAMKTQFDLIIFNTPPLLHVADAKYIASISSGTIIVTHRRKATKEQLLKTKAELQQINAHIIGTVFHISK